MTINKKFVFLLVVMAVLITGCEKDNFKQSCLESRAILEHATSLLIPSVDKSNPQKDTVIINDNSKAKVFIKKKDSDLKRYYNQIKSNIAETNKNYNDAIHAAAYINEMHYFLTGNVLDDRCYYIDLIDKNDKSQLSNWLIDDFFAPLKKDKKYKKSWISMENTKKREIILRIITEDREKCTQ